MVASNRAQIVTLLNSLNKRTLAASRSVLQDVGMRDTWRWHGYWRRHGRFSPTEAEEAGEHAPSAPEDADHWAVHRRCSRRWLWRINGPRRRRCAAGCALP